MRTPQQHPQPHPLDHNLECSTEYSPFTVLQVPLLASLNAAQRSELCTALKPRLFSAGESIVRQGEPGEAFYIASSQHAAGMPVDDVLAIVIAVIVIVIVIVAIVAAVNIVIIVTIDQN